MHTRALVTALAAAAACATLPAHAGDDPSLVSFNGAIGVDPVGGISTATTPPSPLRNDVLGVPPGGRPWILRKFSGRIGVDGSVSLKGRGLLFSGGDGIGTRGSVASVFATLFCGGAAVSHSPAADLDLQGNFTIKGTMVGLPASCVGPVLLIRNNNGTANPPWFAAGIVGDDD